MKIDKPIRRACLAVLAGVVSLASVQAAQFQVTTLGGGPSQFKLGRAGYIDGNTFDAAMFNQPYGLAAFPDGSLVIADRRNNALRKVTAPGDDVEGETSTLGPRVRRPIAVAVGASGMVYSASERDGAVFVHDATGSIVETHSGFVKPTALAVDSAGNIYVATADGAIQVINGGVVSPVAGGFAYPAGMVLVNDSTLAVTDSETHGVYSVDVNTGIVTTIAGANGPGFLDGAFAIAQFNKPHGIALASDGALLVADRKNHRIRKLADGLVSTVYGKSKNTFAGPFQGWRDGNELQAQAREPVGVAVGSSNVIYVTELHWNLLRQVTTNVMTNVVVTNLTTIGS
jgi:sugar lactone lactonase YvrE